MLKKIMAVGLLTISMGGLVSACGGSEEKDSCASDSDCKGDRICDGGECVSPGGANSTPNNGTPNNGTPNNGTPNNGTPNNGTPNNGTPNNGTPNNIAPNNNTEGEIGSECFSNLDCNSEFCRNNECAENDFGNTCMDLGDCAHGACLVRDEGDIAGYCSAPCESFADCPAFWDCEELNNAAGTYCIQG